MNFAQLNVIYKANEQTKEVTKFVEKNHYSKTARSQLPVHIFELRFNDKLVGVALFGKPCGKNVEAKYGKGTIELRRFCLLNDCPENAGSWFIARCIKYLRKHTLVSYIVSYSDPNFKHTGGLYRACNFTYLGKELTSNPRVLKVGKRLVHLRMVYQKYPNTDKYVPSAKRFQLMIKQKKAKILKRKPKDVFIFKLNA